MSRPASLILAAILTLCVPLAAAGDEGFYPIKADDGTTIANHRVPVELESQIEKLPGVVIVGNPRGKVTLHEFYDLNCPYCRKAAADIDALVRSNPELRLVLVPFPVLGIPSIQGARVELAVAQLASPKKFYEFHRTLYAGRGVIDGKRAFAAAKAIGLDLAEVEKIAIGDALVAVMTIVGTLAGFTILMRFVMKGNPQAGLPLLNGGAIAGYLMSFALAFGTFRTFGLL